MLNHLNNQDLISNLKNLVAEERKIITKVLNYLREVERRKLFLARGYPSLYEFCRQELGYSEGCAHRRISAMRLIKDVPEVESKIASGELSLSVVAQTQSHFKKQERKAAPITREQKIELLTKLENASTRECEKILLQLDPESARADKVRTLSDELTELRLTVDKEFMEKLEQAKDLLSHKDSNLSTKEVLILALEEFVVKRDRTRSTQSTKSSTSAPEVKPKSRYISATVKRAVWKKSLGQCCYRDPITGRTCGSRRFLEVDHIVPYSLGGVNNVENLRLLCDAHNRFRWAQGDRGNIKRETDGARKSGQVVLI